MNFQRTRLAAQVMSSLNENFIGEDCCIDCTLPATTFKAAAISKSGERKGICSGCGRNYSELHPGAMVQWKLQQVKNGFYD